MQNGRRSGSIASRGTPSLGSPEESTAPTIWNKLTGSSTRLLTRWTMLNFWMYNELTRSWEKIKKGVSGCAFDIKYMSN